MIGTTVSHYTILEKLGEGGMGVVYKARDTRLDRCVALKFLPPDLTSDEHAKKRFIREAKAASALDHPNIGVVHDIDETDDGRMFICMACYNGTTLPSPGSGTPFKPHEALRLVVQIAHGLGQAHKAGIIHRDIKPANIFLTDQGEPKILDFGLAKLDREGMSGSTHTTGGTAAYMSPEQVTGERSDHRSDLFSLGIVLYELVTDRRPFEGNQMPAVMYSIVHTDPKPPTNVRKDIPKGYDRLILGLLQKDPSHRYQSAEEFCRDAEAVLESRPLEVAPKIRSSRRMRKRLAVSGTVLSVTLTVLLLTWLAPELTRPSRRVAVMPFTMLDAGNREDPVCNWLTINLTDDIVTLRRDDEGLTVMPWEDLRDMKVASIRDAGLRLGVSYVVSGTVETDEDAVSVTVRMNDVASGSIAGSGDFRRSRKHLEELNLEIVLAIAGWLGVSVSDATRAHLASGGTANGDAYELYVRASSLLRNYDDLRNVESAMDLLHEAIALDSTFVRAYTRLAEACLRRYERTKETDLLEEGKKIILKAEMLGPDLTEVRISQGRLLAAGGHHEHARAAFEEALSVDPDRTEALIGLALASAKLRDTVRANAAFLEAIRREPEYWGHYNAYGSYLLYEGRIEEAADQFARIAGIAPENTRGLNNTATCFFMLGDMETAAEYYRRSLAVERNERALSNLATTYFRREMFAESVPFYKEAAELRPTDSRYWGNYAEALHKTGSDPEEESRAYSRAIELAEKQRSADPTDQGLLHRLAGYYIRLGDTGSARTIADTIEILSREDAYALTRAAITREELGDRARALELIERALVLGSNLNEIEENFEMTSLRDSEEYKSLLRKHRNSGEGR